MEIIAASSTPSFTPSFNEAELVTALLASNVNYGWEEAELLSGQTLFRIHASNKQFLVELEEELKRHLPELKISLTVVEEQNWVESWKEFFTPVEAGSRFVVLPPWMEEEKISTSRIPVVIEPKTAFGTGHHASTALCLAALSDLFDAKLVVPGNTFLDLGTGSGILGIAAASLKLIGEGVDPDLISIENALENRAINNIAPESFMLRRGSLEAAEGKAFDLIMANILAEPLVEMSAEIMQRINKGGALVLSGILISQCETVKTAYLPLGEAQLFTQDEWACLVWAKLDKIG
jgi:ribosomal protein L11 methyltransferase